MTLGEDSCSLLRKKAVGRECRLNTRVFKRRQRIRAFSPEMNRAGGGGKAPILPRPGSSSNLSKLGTPVTAAAATTAGTVPANHFGYHHPQANHLGTPQAAARPAAGNGVVQGNGDDLLAPSLTGKVMQIDGQVYQMIPVSSTSITPQPMRPVLPQTALRPKPQGYPQAPAMPQQRISPKSQTILPAAPQILPTGLRPAAPPSTLAPKRPLAAASKTMPAPPFFVTTTTRPLAPGPVSSIKANQISAFSPPQFSPEGLIASFLDHSSFSELTTSPIGVVPEIQEEEEDSFATDHLVSPAPSRPHSPTSLPEHQIKVEPLSAPGDNLEIWANANFVVFEDDPSGQSYQDSSDLAYFEGLDLILFFPLLAVPHPFLPLPQ